MSETLHEPDKERRVSTTRTSGTLRLRYIPQEPKPIDGFLGAAITALLDISDQIRSLSDIKAKAKAGRE